MLNTLLAILTPLVPIILNAVLGWLTKGDEQQAAAVAPINARSALKQAQIAEATATAPTTQQGVVDALRKGEF